MFFFFCLTIGLIVFLATLIFLAIALFHLFQYRLPNQSLKRPIIILIVTSLVIALFSIGLFLTISWE